MTPRAVSAVTSTSQRFASKRNPVVARARSRPKVRFDLGLEKFEMLADAAFVHAAQFAVDPVEVRENDQAHAEGRDSEHIEKRHHRGSTPQLPAVFAGGARGGPFLRGRFRGRTLPDESCRGESGFAFPRARNAKSGARCAARFPERSQCRRYIRRLAPGERRLRERKAHPWARAFCDRFR